MQKSGMINGYETLAKHEPLEQAEREALRILLSSGVFQRAMMLVYQAHAYAAVFAMARGETVDVNAPNVVFGQLWEMCNEP